jgi:hypothetical protein
VPNRSGSRWSTSSKSVRRRETRSSASAIVGASPATVNSPSSSASRTHARTIASSSTTRTDVRSCAAFPPLETVSVRLPAAGLQASEPESSRSSNQNVEPCP